MTENRLRYLLEQHFAKTSTEHERFELFAAVEHELSPEEWQTQLEAAWSDFQAKETVSADRAGQIYQRIADGAFADAHRIPGVSTGNSRSVGWLRYAAILLLILGGTFYLYRKNQQPSISISQVMQPGNKAVLTLSDGSTIVLDSAADGALATEHGTAVSKQGAGMLVYRVPANGAVADAAPVYNTLRTPAGGKFQLVLPDGSIVWLNAASSITFPTAFGADRKVTVTGEVYMEVAPDKTKPFEVNANGIPVQVLGTSFNINVYSDEPAAKVALAEGAISVAGTHLQPGQAYMGGKVVRTDLQQDLAWKNGAFNLNGKTVPELMRQIARWYDLEIVYENPIGSKRVFAGEMGMNLTLEQCIRALDKMQVRCRLEGKKLIVMH